ncbi:MAG TPA: hypothetical protein VG297_21835 [Bryobacteraceae bacterium]|nr:hypothetical protein [Bryobacteraceae bacterium]
MATTPMSEQIPNHRRSGVSEPRDAPVATVWLGKRERRRDAEHGAELVAEDVTVRHG